MAIKLSSVDQFEQVTGESKYIFVLRHSEIHPIPANAYDQFNKFLYKRDMDGYYLVVQQGRDLSGYIAKKTNVKHEPPQTFYFVNSEMVWNRDHDNIDVSSLTRAEE